MVLQEFLDYVGTEYFAYPAFYVGLPAIGRFLGVGPEQITEQTFLRYLDGPRNTRNLLQILELRTEPPMHAEYLLANERSNRHHIEHIREYFP